MWYHIQEYFDNSISGQIQTLYRDLYGVHHSFGIASYLRPPLNNDKIIEPDIIHFADRDSNPNGHYPEVCFGLGDFKTQNYYSSKGFKDLKEAIESTRLLRPQPEYFFRRNAWNPTVLSALVLRKYFTYAFLCCTDRVLISDHQSFSGFFKYDIKNKQMVIDYYIISDPETVVH